jgi:hypothetical protein
MSQIIVTTEETLTLMVKNAVSEAIAPFMPQQKEELKKNLSFNEALEHLNALGYNIGKSHFYKLTMQNEVPCNRFGHKLIFNPEELQNWAESRTKHSNENPVAEAVAKSAGKKLGGQMR